MAVEAIKGHKTISGRPSMGSIPIRSNSGSNRRREELPPVFSDGRARAERAKQEITARLYQQIGQLTMELERLKKVGRDGLGRSVR
ncbi:MAG: hypothetical protein D6723_16875 [Acidobacteria bacterium]|nr:MAG: hypothetical protein D6723_16875 [Acidobacteriota bacterium]